MQARPKRVSLTERQGAWFPPRSGEFDSRRTLLKIKRPIGPVWSGYCPVTAESTGSNPVWVAGKATELLRLRRAVRHLAERPVLETGDCGFDSRLHDLKFGNPANG